MIFELGLSTVGDFVVGDVFLGGAQGLETLVSSEGASEAIGQVKKLFHRGFLSVSGDIDEVAV